ncbi:MAG: L,D-transpeptidase family protein [Gemmatimonadota bacterium]|jgi:murein L,D-transpeptidase YcbB/YkuD|nr:L,D-transpeptidase family protein [Gemmatimonadota bacterium]
MFRVSGIRTFILTVIQLLALLTAGGRTAIGQTTGPSSGEIRASLEALRTAGSARIGSDLLPWSAPLGEFYSRRNNAPVWTDATAAGLVRAIEDASLDGLDPAEYHQATLSSAAPARTASGAELEILRTDAFLRLVHDLGGGKLDESSLTAGRVLDTRIRPALLTDLERAVAVGDPRAALQMFRPTHYIYTGLLKELANYRRIAGAGAWSSIPAGQVIRPGTTDARVEAIRTRLVTLGDLPGEGNRRGSGLPSEVNLADDAFVAGVRSFQDRHGLNADGVIGPATLGEMNVTPEKRIEQLLINLERARWYTHGLPRTFVAVNIASAMAYLNRDGAVVWESRAIVGRPATSTPIFRATMTYIDLNPTWTVPRSINREILSEIGRDPGYMQRTGMRVIDSAGRPVSATREQILSYTAANFPWTFRQDAGPSNALGRIKLMFPNKYNVYLHDTPSRSLFDRDERTFSHGCVRLQDPVGLAVEVLGDAKWNRAAIQAAIDTGTTRTIRLGTPIEVLVLYWTAATTDQGVLRFHRDVYGRDPGVLQGLRKRS